MAKVLSEQAFRDCVGLLNELDVSLAWKGYGTAIFLELGRLSPLGTERSRHESGEACLMLECDWRVESGTSIVIGSAHSTAEIEAGIQKLQGSRIVGVEAFGRVPEIVVGFSNGWCLRTMATRSGNPQWSIKLPTGSWVSARDGVLWQDPEPEDGIGADAEWDVSQRTKARWGIPVAEPVSGKCIHCAWFRHLDADFYLADYGVCITEASPFDGRVVHRHSGCPFFKSSDLD